MVRVARVVAVGVPHHITQRGNNRQDVFFVEDDRRVYLHFLREESTKHGLVIEGYCLMTNHVHLVATPEGDDSLATALGRAHFRYSMYINNMHERSGHLWQNRFYSCPLEGAHYLHSIRYIERNPVRTGVVNKAWEYEWSSAGAHTGKTPPDILLNLRRWRGEMSEKSWEKLLVEKDDESEMLILRSSTRTGRPLGDDSFVDKLETKLGRCLRPLPHGRPKNKNIK